VSACCCAPRTSVWSLADGGGRSATPGATTGNVMLRRPARAWGATCKRHVVGARMGLYLVTCDAGAPASSHDGRPGLVAETAFVPMHFVELELELPPLPAGKKLLIVPSTFERGVEVRRRAGWRHFIACVPVSPFCVRAPGSLWVLLAC
jgi:hypothetical protein